MSNWSHTNILGLQLRQSVSLRKLTRTELFSRLQLIQTVDPIVSKAYEISEEKILEQQLDDDPHGHLWHVSFHGSQFPGTEMSCARQALYRMMDFPPSAPTSRLLRQTASLGKEFEADLVRTWHNAGMLLSSPDPENQTGFELPGAWLTSSVDAIILPPGKNKPLVIEVKQRKAEVLREMRLGKRGPFPEHVNQIKVQIAFVRMYQVTGVFLSSLDPITHGFIYYGSRDNPLETAEFRVDYDPEYFDAGVKRLMQYREYFEKNILPEDNPGKRSTIFGHPNGWKWSYPPCATCPFKKTCQLDFRESVTKLTESVGIDRAKKIRKDYDPVAAAFRVIERWKDQYEKEEQQEEAA